MDYSLRDGKGGRAYSIKEIKLNDITIGVFAGSRGHNPDHDILIKYQEDGKRVRTPKQSDGYTAYPKAIKKAFGYNNKERKFKVVHNKVTQLKNMGFNHKIERLHNNIRQRTKTFRGFKNLDSANAIMKGFEVYYNFIMKHQAIKCCPYELATDLKLTKPNKWIELIKMSKK